MLVACVDRRRAGLAADYRPVMPAVIVARIPSSRAHHRRSKGGQGSMAAAAAAGRSSTRRRQGDFGGLSVRAARLAEPGSRGAASVRRCTSERMARRGLVRQLQVEARTSSGDPIEHRGVAPVARLAALDVRELRQPQALDDGAQADPSGRLRPQLGDIGMVGVVVQRLVEGVGAADPAAVLAEPLDRLQHQTREILGVAGQRARHSGIPP